MCVHVLYVRVCVRLHVCVHVGSACMCVCMCICVYECASACRCVNVYMHMCMCAYMYTRWTNILENSSILENCGGSTRQYLDMYLHVPVSPEQLTTFPAS